MSFAADASVALNLRYNLICLHQNTQPPFHDISCFRDHRSMSANPVQPSLPLVIILTSIEFIVPSSDPSSISTTKPSTPSSSLHEQYVPSPAAFYTRTACTSTHL